MQSSKRDDDKGASKKIILSSATSNSRPQPTPAFKAIIELSDKEIIVEGETVSDELQDEAVETEETIDPQNYLDTALQVYEESQELWSSDNPEEAIDALDEAYQNILHVDAGDDAELDQQVENLRFMISKRILEIYSARHVTVNGSSNAIPLIMNSYVEREIKRFKGRELKFFIQSYKRSGKYRDKMVKALKEAGLPEELSWLPLIESGFKVNALSRARALGLWQFIPSTGYKFDLRRDSWIDERLDPEKSTTAAIAYLKELHNIFGDWTTVLAAYNCGETRVLKLIRSQKINYLDNFWDLYERLPRETARYVPRFMATLHILKDPAKYGIDLGETEEPDVFETVAVKKQMSLRVIAKKLRIPLAELVSLNPVLRHRITPNTAYNLKVPEGMGTTLMAKLDRIPRTSLPKRSFKIHRVKRGETLSHIARRYGSSVRKIARANKINRKHLIKVGQRIKIPAGRNTGKRSYYSRSKQSPKKTYLVRKGDSLWSIAKQFKTTINEIKKLNNLKSSTVYYNQRLRISRL
jgi:membrane-bound lytic murein transglycosylase D